MDMLSHNLLVSYRSFKRNHTSFFINLTGLSTGLACTLLIYLWVTDELTMDQFHEKNDRLYQVMEHREQAGKLVTFQSTSGPTAKALAEEMPEIEYAITATRPYKYILSHDNTDIKAIGRYVGKDFYALFSYPLLQGLPNQVLSDKSSIVISEALAISLFGTTENAVGKMVEWQHEKQYQVSGVFKNIPPHSSAQFDFLLSFEAYREGRSWVDEWGNTSPMTYALLKQGANVDQFNEKIADFIRDKTDGKVIHRTMFITPYAERYLHGKYENGVRTGGRITYVRLFSIIAVFTLIIACINFMNLSTARATRRFKEVGIRKAIGAGRKSLIVQYLGESVLLAFLSLLLAILLIWLALPRFNEITNKQLSLDLTPELTLVLLGITALTGLLAGSYPALYLSGFDPVAILKGKLNRSLGELWARQGLVVFQFTLSIILIVTVVVVYQQIEFVQTRNLGYDKDNTIYLRKEGKNLNSNGLETFLSELKRIPGVTAASSIGHDMTGHNSGTYRVIWEGRDPNDRTEFEAVSVNYDMIELLDIEIELGRTFSPDFASDSSGIIFNESAIEYMGLENPIGKVIELWYKEREITGVVKDFHFESLHEEVKPLFFYLAPQRTWNVMAKMEEGRERETLDQIQAFYREFNPGFPFDYQFLDEDYKAQYEAEQRVSTLSRYFAGIAVLISCLGLFGLATFAAEKRLKEIGIRKILGAGSLRIVSLLTVDFTRMVLLSVVIALPMSYFIASSWLESFAFRIELRWWFFAGAGLLALFIAWTTISFQTIKAANTNPVRSLKDE